MLLGRHLSALRRGPICLSPRLRCLSYLSADGSPLVRRATTILAVRKGSETVMIGDGQCTYGSIVIKSSSKKVRTLSEGRVLAGMAGAVSDAFVLIDLLEQKLEEYPGQLMRACVEMNKLWRTDKMLRRLEASLLVADKEVILEVSGDGNVIAPDFGVASIGSGSVAALSAARALIDDDRLSAEQIALKSMNIAADLCVYTNHNFTIAKVGENLPNQISEPEKYEP